MRKVEKYLQIFFGLLFLKIVLLAFYAGSEIGGATHPENVTASYNPNCVEELKSALLQEKEALEVERRSLLVRQEELKLLEKRTQEQFTALKELIQKADEKLQELRGVQDERFKLLVKSYGEMKPSKAAQQLVNMDRETAIKILSQLKSTQVASILSAMPPDKAAALAEAMTGAPALE